MKKISIILSIFMTTLLLVTSCDIDDKFVSPDRTDKGTVPSFFTSMVNNQRMRTEYWHVRTFLCDHLSVYAQTMVLNNGSTVYKQRDAYIQDYWRDFYVSRDGDEYTGKGGTLAMYAFMKKNNDADLPEVQKTNIPFMNAAKIIVADRGAQMVDMFGDIPYTEAASLLQAGVSTPAKFDDQQSLYKLFIEDLKDAAAYFKTATATSYFTSKDMMLKGDVDKWCRYANSLRLRLLMRIVEVDPGYAQPLITQIINNPAEYPLVDGDNNPNYDPAKIDILINPLDTYNSSLSEALNEGNSSVAPDFLMNNILVPTNDPRLDALFDKNGQSDYKAPPITVPSETLVEWKKQTSCWDSTTFWYNTKIPGVRLTASETNFLKAEAFERFGSTADAKAAYEMALKQSVTFYYYLNSSSSEAKKATKPSADVIEAFVTERVAYTGDKENKLKLIGTQKWVHFGWLQGIEAWSEYRRTKYPVLLDFPSEGKDIGYEAPPTRLLYPTLETSLNPNYESVRAKDTRTTKIFWDVK